MEIENDDKQNNKTKTTYRLLPIVILSDTLFTRKRILI